MSAQAQRGYTIMELLVAVALSALLLVAVSGLVSQAHTVRNHSQVRVDALRDARFAMQRMLDAVFATERLLLPIADNPATNWRENVREQTEPPSLPEGSSTQASAVLAVSLDRTLDLNRDGFADADNDKDGRIDEDWDDDMSNDLKPGIANIDDDGDGSVDELPGGATFDDDDEDGIDNDDKLDGLDDDGDGAVDEDGFADMNRDLQPGVAGVDDDGDGLIDEGPLTDDDEDGTVNEDWLDVHVFYMNNGQLIERRPNVDPVDGNDFSEYIIADHVTRFRAERVADPGKRATLIDLTLELDYPGADPVRLQTRARVRTGQ